MELNSEIELNQVNENDIIFLYQLLKERDPKNLFYLDLTQIGILLKKMVRK